MVIPAFDRVASLLSVLQAWRQCGSNIELVVVDDKSPHMESIKKLARQYDCTYVRNTSGELERQPALCRNMGFDASSGDIVVFNDADILPAPNAIELYTRYHARYANVAVDAEVLSITAGQEAVNRMQRLTIDELMSASRTAIHSEPFVSTSENPTLSADWWAFLSAQCSFKRDDLHRLGGWDEDYVGWGVEDNDIGYKICKAGLRIIYARDIPCFHIDHTLSQREYRDKCASALRNLKLMCQKYPEIATDKRVIDRIRELEILVKSDLSLVKKQGTAGGGPIKDPIVDS